MSTYTKYICAYGVLIVGTNDYPDANMLYAANTIANILDPANNGYVQDATFRELFD
jgi:hypothetical protein